MKTNVKLLYAIALLASACTTGSMVTSSRYTDDVYFRPGDNPPVVAAAPSPSIARQTERPALNADARQEEAGNEVDNYRLGQKSGNLESGNYVYNNDSAYSDTTYEQDEKAKYLADDYEDNEETSYAARIRTFHNPYIYDPYWDSYYIPGFGFNWNFGFGSWGIGFYDPFYYGWRYNPWYYGHGGYYPCYGYYGGGYYNSGYWGFGFYGGGYYGYNTVDARNRYYGRQNYTDGGRSNAVRYSGSSSSYSTVNPGARVGTSGYAGGTTNVSRRDNPNQSVATQSTETLTNLRRSPSSPSNQTGVNRAGQGVRQGSSSNPARGYTPTYSRPRTNTQATYNSGPTRQYQGSPSSSYSGGNRYSRPQGSGTYSSGRSSSAGSSYQRGSSSSNSGYTAPANSSPTRSSGSSSGSYTAPTKSGSSSYSTGRSSGGNGSSGGSSGSSSGSSSSGSGRRH